MDLIMKSRESILAEVMVEATKVGETEFYTEEVIDAIVTRVIAHPLSYNNDVYSAICDYWADQEKSWNN